MHRLFSDHLPRLNSPLHRLPAWLKLLFAAAFLAATLIIPMRLPWLFAIVAALLVLIAIFARIPLRLILLRLVLFEPIILGVAGLAFFSPDGWRIFLSILARSSLCLLTMIILSATTSFSDILRILRAIHVPWLLLTTLTLMYRYIFVLADEAHRMRRARLSRTYHSSRWRTWKSLGTVIAQLFVRSSERAERIYAAMCSRGWR